MTFRTYSLVLSLTMTTLAFGCDTVDPDAPGGGTGAGKADTGEDPPPPGSYDCNEGFELVDTSTDCIADASCYELPDGMWCTGECPEDQELDDADPPQCVGPDVPDSPCAEGFEQVDGADECLLDVACYELEDGSWCTGLCPVGQQLDYSDPPQCVDAAFGGCLPGFELVDTTTHCIADAVCYEVAPFGWCTGECLEGEYTPTETGPACI